MTRPVWGEMKRGQGDPKGGARSPRAYVGFGANLGRPAETYASAGVAIQGAGHHVLACSSLFQSRSLLRGQPHYLNGLIEIAPHGSAEELLTDLATIETSLGRTRGERWAARTIDLDLILFYENCEGDPAEWRPLVRSGQTELELPHPRLCERDFVLAPILELAPSLRLCGGHTAEQWLRHLPPGQRTLTGSTLGAVMAESP